MDEPFRSSRSGYFADLLTGPPEVVAPALLGATISHGPVVIRLTETEGYAGLGEDAASHAHRGVTPRNTVMFGPAGRLYVYFTYGMHWCLNIVCGPTGTASAVLLRAGVVVQGVSTVRTRKPLGIIPKDFARGPARLAAALGLDGTVNGVDLLDPRSPVRLRAAVEPPGVIETGPRVGVSAEAERAWRFWISGDPTVSAYRRAAPRGTRRRDT